MHVTARECRALGWLLALQTYALHVHSGAMSFV